MGFSVMLRGAEKLVPAEYWCPTGTYVLKEWYQKLIFRSSYIDILNCALQHHLHIINPALAELPIGAQKHYKE